MSKFLIGLYLVAALVNLITFFADGYNVDKLVIAGLFVAIAIDTFGDLLRERVSR